MGLRWTVINISPKTEDAKCHKLNWLSHSSHSEKWQAICIIKGNIVRNNWTGCEAIKLEENIDVNDDDNCVGTASCRSSDIEAIW